MLFFHEASLFEFVEGVAEFAIKRIELLDIIVASTTLVPKCKGSLLSADRSDRAELIVTINNAERFLRCLI